MKLITLKSKENKQASTDHISGFTIKSTITGLLVTNTDAGIPNQNWFDEYMLKHCVVSVGMSDVGDYVRIHSSDADVFNIRGFVVSLDIIYNQDIDYYHDGVLSGKDVVEKQVYKRFEVVIPHHNFFGSEGIDTAHNVIKGFGFNHLARKERLAEIKANKVVKDRSLKEQIQESEEKANH